MQTSFNNVLGNGSDSTSHQKRIDIARAFIATGDKLTAMNAMKAAIKAAQAKKPHLFDATDRTPIAVESSAQELLDDIVEEIREDESYLELTKPVLSATGARDGSDSFALPARQVAADVLGVLKACRVEDARVYLPATRLDRKLYTSVNDVLTAMGGRWKGGKTQAHVFADVDHDAFKACFEDLQATGAYVNPKDLSFFPTPPDLARRVVQMAQVELGMSTGEFSAGNGAIALELANAAGNPANVFCVEVFPPNVKILMGHGFGVHEGDFLSMEPPTTEAEKFDRIVINPPFSNHQDAAHVLHACKFLRESGRLVAITSTSWQHQKSNKKAAQFRNFIEQTQAEVEHIPAGEFKSSGTMVPTTVLAIEGSNLPWYQADEQEHEHELTGAPAP